MVVEVCECVLSFSICFSKVSEMIIVVVLKYMVMCFMEIKEVGKICGVIVVMML